MTWNIVELISSAKEDFKDYAMAVAGKTAVKVAGSPLGQDVIRQGVKSFLTSEDIKEQSAEAAAHEVVELKNFMKVGAEPYLKNAAEGMGVKEAPAWKQIYDQISSPNDFFLIRPIKGLFSLVLSGVANVASFFTAKAVNAILKPEEENKITQPTVKSVFIGLFNKAFGIMKPASA